MMSAGASASAVEASAWRMAMEVAWREEKSAEGRRGQGGARSRARVMSPPVVVAAMAAMMLSAIETIDTPPPATVGRECAAARWSGMESE